MSEPRRGEIWRVDLEPTRGDEIRKIRPAVILSDDSIGRLALCIVVPCTEWKERYTQALWMVRIDPTSENGLTKLSSADAFQIRSISVDRLQERLGALPDSTTDAIAEAVALCIAYRHRSGDLV